MNTRIASLLQHAVLPLALVIMRPLVTWLLRSGVGYGEFCVALKPLFLANAQAEQRQSGGKQTDSAISLLSGLHRKDVRELMAARDAAAVAPEAASAAMEAAGRPVPSPLHKATPANQVVTRWLAEAWAEQLPVAGPAPSFEMLARSVSRDIHPRSVLQELVRLGLVEEKGSQVRLQVAAFVPDARHDEARQLLAGSVADHLAAGVHNLTVRDGKRFLEQSVFADGLSAASAQELEQLANSLWRDVMSAMVKAAVPLCEKDEPLGGSHRVRLGMFCWSTDEKNKPEEGSSP